MQDSIEAIVERVQFEDKEKVLKFLNRCVAISNDSSKSTYATRDNVLFKIDNFYTEIHKLTNHVKKDLKLPMSVETLCITMEELGVEMTKEESFILFHLKDIGKFSIKDKKLKEELMPSIGQFKEYAGAAEDLSDYLNSLANIGFIELRRGAIRLNRSLIIRYK